MVLTLKIIKMKQLKLTAICLFVSAMVFGQSLERQVIGNAGESVQNGTAGLSYTIGEQATASQIIPATKLTQGFQQVDPEEFVGILDLYAQQIQASVYPNPTVNILKLRSDLYTIGIDELDFQVLDLHGKLVLQGVVLSDGGSFDVSSLAASTYTLVLRSSNGDFEQKIRFVKIRL